MGKNSKKAFCPRLEALEERSLMACSVFVSPEGVLNIVGDRAPDRVLLYDSGGGAVAGIASGHGFFTFNGIKDIVVDTGGGNDYVEYNLVDDLQRETRTVEVNLRDGHDTFLARLRNPFTGQPSDLLPGALLGMKVVGEGGNDRLFFDAAQVDLHEATMKIGFHGGAGDDTIVMLYSGLLDHGGVSFFAYGDQDQDRIAMLFAIDPASVAPHPGGVRGFIEGGDGDDLMALLVDAPPAVSQFQTGIDGGTGNDIAWTNIPMSHVQNVEVPIFV